MNLSEREIYDDYCRFIRHEAMRANCLQEEVLQVISEQQAIARVINQVKKK